MSKEVHFTCPKCHASGAAGKTFTVFTKKNSALDAILEERVKRSEIEAEMAAMKLERYASTQFNKARGINFGFLAEKIVPTMDEFPWNPFDCKPLFDPIDFVIFEGMSEGEITGITFIDVKTGGSQLTKKQQQIKFLVQNDGVELC